MGLLKKTLFESFEVIVDMEWWLAELDYSARGAG